MYKKNEYEWKDYEREIKELNKFLNEIFYDGFSKNCFENAKKISGFPTAYLKREESVGSKLFLLPKDYDLVNLDDLFKPLPPPEFPIPMNEPELTLKKSDYPDWYEKYIERDVEKRLKLTAQMTNLKKKLKAKEDEFQNIYLNLLSSLSKIKMEQTSDSNARIIEFAHKKHNLPQFLKNKFDVSIDVESRIAIVEFKFPDYSDQDLVIGHTGQKIKTKKLASESLKKKLIKQCLYSLIIRAAYLAAKYRQPKTYEIIVVNVEQDWFDPATGQFRNGLIASLQAPVEYLESLNLAKLDSESCFKYLKGIMTPSLQNISPIRPIFVLNKNDDRIVPNKDIDIELGSETNLALLPWEDFEHLVAQLFEWEFAKNGVEVKVTRVSRDRGVDAILYDPEPLKGGKYVLQAKRYTRTVDVSAVRDLYGTVLNEGANRGILITTSSYGPDAYEFAKDKPISLVDGQNLLLMLQKHGKKYCINLEEARRLNKEFKEG